jgi:hypothetical protein
MCLSNIEYEYLNPTTQLSLFSNCISNCSFINNIKWNIYQGIINSSTNIIQWNQIQNEFFGKRTQQDLSNIDKN